MKVHYKTKSGRLIFEMEGRSAKQLFHDIATMQEIFESDSTCGACNSESIRFRVRTNQDIQFYELYCEDCTATLSFGQTREGERLFAKRKDADGEPLSDRGWKVWNRAIAAAPKAQAAAAPWNGPDKKEEDDIPF